MDKDTKINPNIMTDVINNELQDMLRKGVKSKDEFRARLDQYLAWRLYIYDTYGWKGKNLADLFVEDFEYFEKDDFEAFGKNDIKRLRTQLRSNGAYIRVKRFMPISEALVEAIREELI